jgi:carboxyl-terminal processing protease
MEYKVEAKGDAGVWATELTHNLRRDIVRDSTDPVLQQGFNSMNQKFTRWMAVAALAIAGTAPMISLRAHADEPKPAEATAVDQLKTQAYKALRVGNFDAGNDLLAQAAKLSTDPQLAKMHEWTSQFDGELKGFTDERHKAYDKAVDDVKKLVEKNHEDAALDFANRAQLLSDDKKAFHDLPWMKSLIADGIKHGADYETAEDWVHAQRVYSDLSAVEPSSRDWKEKLKSVTRRSRLLSIYAPDVLKDLLATDLKERDEVDAILNPPVAGATPATQPTTKPVDPMAANDDFKSDWHDAIKGIQMPMLTTALDDAFLEYYRDVTYRGLMSGGISALDAVINTRGLEKTFPSLADAGKRKQFQDFLNDWKAKVAAANADNEKDLINQLLSTDDKDGILAANARTLKLPDEVLISEFGDGALATLDPFSNMIWPTEVAEFNKATQGDFSGIGVQILPEENGDLRIVRPLPGSPAMKMGIRAADVIAKINGKSAKGITSDEAVKHITGPSGTMVNLTIRSPDGTTRTLDVKREKIKVESVEGYTRKNDNGKWDYYVDPENKIAYLRITSFSGYTVKELHAAMDSMGDDVNGVIIDLRGNPGGLLQAAIGVCNEFLTDGNVVVSTHPDRETHNGPTEARADDDHGKKFTKPMVVLVNQYSASASEIVSGALKDDHRALLVGQRTFGKGSVQQIFKLDEQETAMAKLTTAHYYLPSGRCIHREENSTEWGVDPDVTVDLTPEQMRTAQEARMETEAAPGDYVPKPSTQPSAIVPPKAIEQGANPMNPVAQAPSTQPAAHKTLLEADPQLAAGLLVLRLQLTGAPL